uniref:NGFI-A-binding protein homolog n=2 Tax=Ascaris TaxID=6251 RepID=A0A0M3ICZ4_ASCLU
MIGMSDFSVAKDFKNRIGSDHPRPTGRQPTTFSEWQLLAVLHRANLLQYYDDFIAQGGDDINQFMTCDEHEFLEIMSVVGMASKPLHVRRFQRTLTEFSKDPDAFNMLAIQQIGVPPMAGYVAPPSSSATAPNPAAALQFLLSSQGLAAASLAVAAALPSTSPSITHDRGSPRGTSQGLAQSQSTSRSSNSTESMHDFAPIASTSTSVGATANVLPGDLLTSLVTATHSSAVTAAPFHPSEVTNCLPTTTIASLLGSSNHSSQTTFGLPLATSPSSTALDTSADFEQLGPATAASETPILTEAQIGRLAQCSLRLIDQMPQLEPKLIQNKKKISRELLDVMQLPRGSPQRLQEYRKYSAIYGRFDAKRKPDKPLTLHEVSVNEAAAQLCLRQPALLTRRDELFPLARQVVKDAGYNYVKGMKKSDAEIRKRLAVPPDCYTSEPSQSPQSSVSAGSPPPEEYVADSGNELISAANAPPTATVTTTNVEMVVSRKRCRPESPLDSKSDTVQMPSNTTDVIAHEKWSRTQRQSDTTTDGDP